MTGGDLADYQVNAQFTNIGNATIYDLYADYNDQYSFTHMGQGWLYTALARLTMVLPAR